MFKTSLDKSFSRLPKTNSDLMMSNLKYRDMVEMETKEATSSGSVGQYSAPVFNEEDDTEFWDKSRSETPKPKKDTKKIEATEATGSGSVGAYETPAAWAKSTKRKDWRGAKKPLYKGGAFVTVKKKCKTFPYCNQGDINSLKIRESEELRQAIEATSKKTGLNQDLIRMILIQEFNKNK